MAKTKNVTTTFKRKGNKLVKQSKTVNVATNTQKGANTPNLSKNQLKAMQIKADKDIKIAQIGSKATNIASVTGQTASVIKQGVGQNSNMTKKNDSGVQQSVNGGLKDSSTSRDDDDNPYVY